jgi:putative tricarboxylic transport membrane protein
VPDLFAAIFLLALSTFVIIEAVRMPARGPLGFFTGPGLLPMLLGVALAILSATLMAQTLRLGVVLAVPQWPRGLVTPEAVRLGVVVTLLGIMVLLLGRVPFWAANLVYFTMTFAYLRVGGGRPLMVLLYSGLMTFVIGYLLPIAFRLHMP